MIDRFSTYKVKAPSKPYGRSIRQLIRDLKPLGGGGDALNKAMKEVPDASPDTKRKWIKALGW